MRERPVVVFFAGFALGLVFLAVLLWGTGRLRNMHASAVPGRPQETQTQPAQMPNASSSRPSATPQDPPPVPAPTAAGEELPDQPLMQRRLDSRAGRPR
jgi:hypothetical protein